MGISVLAEIVFTHITDVEIGHLGQGLAGEVGRELGVVHQGGQPLVGVGLVQVDLGHVGPVTGHDVVGLVAGELEAVVAAGASPGVELIAAETSHQAWLAGLEVGHFVQMSLPRRVLLGGLEVDLVVDLVPVVDVGHHHPPAGDGDPLVGVSVDHIHLDRKF